MPQSKPHPRAFTLIELIVVISIIVILLSVMIPTVSTLMRGNNQKQAVNTISAYLASARATALNNKVPAGVIFYEDQSNGNATAISLAIQDQSAAPYTLKPFGTTVNGAHIDYLPLGIKVAAIDGTGSTFTVDSANGGGTPRIIMFDASGQLILVGNITLKPNLSTVIWQWQPSVGAPGIPLTGLVSTPALVAYDGNQLKGYLQANTSATPTQWLNRYADTIVINTYTGNVIR